MKKITLSLLLLLSVVLSTHSQVLIGNGTNTSQQVPFNPYYGYSYGQSIYLGTEINAAGNITSIQWYYSGSGTMPYSQELVVYLGTTTKSSFANNSDWEPLSSLTQVYSGGISTDSAPGWVTITFDTPFAYDGTSNLVVAVEENLADYDEDDDKFYNTAVSENRSLAYWSDTNNPDPASPPTGNDSYPRAFVPNIIFGGITQTYETPISLMSSNVTTDSATISWAAPTNPVPGGSDYYVSTSNTAPTATTVPTGNVPSGETVTISSLTPATTYYVWVRNNYGGGLYSSWSSPAVLLTECVAISAFYENFDSVETPDLPTCWGKILRGGTLSEYAYVETVDYDNPVSTPNQVELYTSDSTLGDDIILVSPNLNTLSLGTYRIKLNAHGYDAGLQVGTLDSADADTATFTPLETVPVTQLNAEYVFDFSTYTGTDTYIGFRIDGEDYASIFLDNIRWELTPLCPDVTEIVVTSATTTSAGFEWNAGGTETSWDVAVGPASTTDPNTLTATNTLVNSFTATPLTENTDYKVWVRSVCGGTNGNGAWIGPVTFTTPCLATATFNENFDGVTTPNLPDCWTKILRGSGLSPNADVETSTYPVMTSAPNNVFLGNGNSAAGTDIILVSPNLSTLSLGTYRLKFNAKYDGGLQVGTLDGCTNSATFTPLQDISTTNTTTEYVVDFSEYTGTDTYIGFRLNAPGPYYQVNLDNIVWELAPLCPDVTGIMVPVATTTGATIEWTAGDAETAWEVAVGPATTTDPSTLTPVSSTATTKDITGLSADTNYKVWVRSSCGSNDGAWIGPVSFATPCLPIATFNENFDSVSTPNLPACWTKILTGPGLSEYAYVQTSSAEVSSNPNSVSLYNSSSQPTATIMLVSPNLSTLSLGTYRLKFYAIQNWSDGDLEIGTLNSATSGVSFSPIETISVTDVLTQYVVDFSSYTGTDTFIGIKLTGNTYSQIDLDNIIWELAPLCPDVTAINVPSTTTSSATVSWTGGGSETSWEVAVGLSTVTDPNTLTPVASSTETTEVGGLTDATSYKVWVRSVCGGTNGNGAWIGPVAFNTQCFPTSTLPYLENFETAVVPAMPSCVTAINEGSGNDWVISDDPGYGFTSKTLTYYYDSDYAANAWFFTRGINLTAGQDYNISYRYGCNSTNYEEKMQVMYGTGASSGEMTEMLAEYIDFNGGPYEASIPFTAPTTGTYYFGFNLFSTANQYNVFVDDILVDNALATSKFDLANFNYYPNPVKDVLNISALKNITKVSVYNIIGQEVITKSLNENKTKVDMYSLAKGTYMVKVTADNMVKTIKVIKQ